jgi:putative tributyrin esterase
MALITARFNSSILYKQVELHLLVPEGDGPFPVCYLLHGGGDDSSNWLRNSRIETIAQNLPLIIAMPDCYYSFCVDHYDGPAYAQYLLKDVVGFVERTFPVIKHRNSRCIGGLSMGGYGALHLALSNPDVFVSAHSSAGCFGFWGEHLKHWNMAFSDDYLAMLRRIHGPRGDDSDLHLFTLAKKAASHQRLPALRLDCGASDSLLQTNRDFHSHLTALQIPHTYSESPGDHNWIYFDSQIAGALEFHLRSMKSHD